MCLPLEYRIVVQDIRDASTHTLEPLDPIFESLVGPGPITEPAYRRAVYLDYFRKLGRCSQRLNGRFLVYCFPYTGTVPQCAYVGRLFGDPRRGAWTLDDTSARAP